MTKPTFFIYMHRRNDTGDVFYIGKGTRTKKHQYSRAYDSTSRNRLWRRITKKAGYTVELVADFFLEEHCFDLERNLIAQYKRRCEGGTLCNLTAGGDGHSGYSPSTETREKLSTMFSKERHPNWGKRLSAETCRRKSESMKASEKNLSGKKLPQEWKQKIAATKFGERNPMYGRTGAKHPRSRVVVHKHAGIFFESMTEAAEWCDMKVGTLYNMLIGTNPNKTTLELA